MHKVPQATVGDNVRAAKMPDLELQDFLDKDSRGALSVIVEVARKPLALKQSGGVMARASSTRRSTADDAAMERVGAWFAALPSSAGVQRFDASRVFGATLSAAQLREILASPDVVSIRPNREHYVR